ncbi:exopolysaccharide biosynthesis protein [Enterococcus avium]|nr:exopolysaccharide biosynthesis protein [Enterococcus avium]
MIDNENRISSLKTIEIVQSNRRENYYQIVKRGMDILGGLIGIIFFLIAYFLLFVPYHMGENKGSMLFKQRRLGKNGELFEIYKFRSMKTNANEILKNDRDLYQKYVESGYKLEVYEDPRITRLGKFIRKASIDELPQFVNVLKGEMSLVGPRPIVEEELIEYGDSKNKFLNVKPGLTGLWQVSGRSAVGYPERCELELDYVEKASLKCDIKILFKTFVTVLRKEGAF